VEGARPAVREDAERCGALVRQALAEIQAVRGGNLLARGDGGLVAKALLRPGGLDTLLASPRRRVLVGTVDGEVVGLAVGRVDDVGEAAIGIVDACYVEPDARCVGVGRALLDGLVAFFAGHACRGVDASALPGDRETKNFFEAAGFKARLLTLHRPMP
jgi:GNAT superfamily N-acetyltransferase